MKVGDRVRRFNVLDFEGVYGTVVGVSKDRVIINWDGLFGQWPYTKNQMNKIKLVEKKAV